MGVHAEVADIVCGTGVDEIATEDHYVSCVERERHLLIVTDLWAKSCRRSIAIMVFACSFGSYSSMSERSMPSDSREGSSIRSTHKTGCARSKGCAALHTAHPPPAYRSLAQCAPAVALVGS